MKMSVHVKRLLMIGLVTVLTLGALNLVNAQTPFPKPIVNPPIPAPIGPSDLTVSVNAPAEVSVLDKVLLEIKVDNLAPPFPYQSAFNWSSYVRVQVDLTGLGPFSIESEKLTCSFVISIRDWQYLTCSGSIPYGGAATIGVWVTPSNEYYCGMPLYTDAAVFTDGRERSKTNNRAIARSTVTSPFCG